MMEGKLGLRDKEMRRRGKEEWASCAVELSIIRFYYFSEILARVFCRLIIEFLQ
jgi:hypothetical protein